MSKENTKTTAVPRPQLMRLLADFIGDKAEFDEYGSRYIWGVKGEDLQMIGEVRGWGAIQYMFKNKDGSFDSEKAEEFQDFMGKFIADAITEKLQREKDC